jgi:DNA-binding NtrC family response regulator
MDAQRTGPPVTPEPISLESLLAEVETSYILWALAQSKDNKTMAADLLGLTRPRLYRRMEALGLVDSPAAPAEFDQGTSSSGADDRS